MSKDSMRFLCVCMFYAFHISIKNKLFIICLIFNKKKYMRAKKVLKLVHSDLCGPINPTSNGGKRYFIMFIDDYSQKTFHLLNVSKHWLKKNWHANKDSS